MRITRIENQKKRPGRKNIYADGTFIAGVSSETLLKLALRTGDEIGTEQLKALHAAEAWQNARNTAIRFLSSRPRTERELRTKLREKEFSEEEITAVIEDLRRTGLLNDREFARMAVRDAKKLRPVAAPLLRRKLILLGVNPATVDDVLAEELPAADQRAVARELAARFLAKAGAAGRQQPEKLRSRLSGFLARRGFPWETIRDVIRETLQHDE